LEACNAKPEDFKQALEDCVESWEYRVYQIINSDEEPVPKTDRMANAVMALATSMNNRRESDINVTVEREQPQSINITMPKNDPPIVNVQVPEQQAPIVNVTTPTQLAPIVNVTTPKQEAPLVTITNDIQPAAVDVNVNIPKRVTRTTIKRDKTGAVTGSEQIEEDA
jgi:hypothetical protein